LFTHRLSAPSRLLRGKAVRLAFLVWVAAAAQSACSTPPGVPATREEFLSAQTVNGQFRNPRGSPTASNNWREEMSLWWWAAVGAKKEELSPPVPPEHVLQLDQALAMLAARGTEEDSLTWLGHSAFLIRLSGRTILVDPFLTEYASPIAGIGPRRYAGPVIMVARLPAVDTLVISHNHYDHLDLRAIRQLPAKGKVSVIVPAGLGALLRANGFTDVTELSWGDSLSLERLKITSVPAVHFSSRGLFDHDKTLWSGYVFESSLRRVYFAGDTAYHDTLFKQLCQTIGPVDIALVPIGVYEPRKVMADVHVNPEEAVELGRDMGAQALVGMHWGTIVLSTDPPFEPPRRFRAAGRAKGYSDKALWVMAIGETRSFADQVGRNCTSLSTNVRQPTSP
jgi:N-acyl-phosphatidylethanolamine-hydrolysing phospholipase D